MSELKDLENKYNNDKIKYLIDIIRNGPILNIISKDENKEIIETNIGNFSFLEWDSAIILSKLKNNNL